MATGFSHSAKIAKGDLKGLTFLFAPILLVAFSNGIFLLIEKYFFARLSIQAIEVAVSVAYVIQIFQSPCMALAMMAQVFVGRWLGAQDFRRIGPGIWQFIWFSAFAMIGILPFGYLFGNYYFAGMEIEQQALPYYRFLLPIAFFYILGAGLSSFYLGLGKTRLVLWASLGSQCLKTLFAYLLIFGWSPWIPKLGLLGGAISSAIAQGAYCLLLLGVFLNCKQKDTYHTHCWSLNPKLFWECIHTGMFRALCRLLTFLSWASIAHLMGIRGGNYLLVLSIGGTLFLSFLGDAICQSQITVIAQLLGNRNNLGLKKAFRSASILISAILLLLTVPYFVFPQEIFHYFFPSASLSDEAIRKVFMGIWISSAFYLFVFIPISYVLAFKDTKFSAFMGFFNWINGFCLMYVAIEKFDIAPESFWLTLSLMHASTALIYYFRMKWLLAKQLTSHNQPKTSSFLVAGSELAGPKLS